MNTETVFIKDITSFADNPRVHNEAQIKALADSIKEFSQYRPVVIDENNMILAGHGICQAVEYLGQTEVIVKRITGLSDSDKKKLVLVDNRVQSLGSDNYSKIEDLIKDIGEIEITGFDDDFIKSILAETAEEKTEVFAGKEEKIFGKDHTTLDPKSLRGSTKQGYTADEVETAMPSEKEEQVMEVVCPHCNKKLKVTF
jgi:hypothetical protein